MSRNLPAADAIILVDLEVYCRVGVPDEERAKPQRLLISVRMERDFSKAASSDDLRQTIDYFSVSRRLLRLGEGREWRLIETLAVEIAELIRAEFGADRVGVEVKKFILPEARYVSVQTSRG